MSEATSEITVSTLPVTPLTVGHQGTATALDDVSAHDFLVRQILSTVATSSLVRVVAVSTSGGLSPIGTVDVSPLVNMIDGLGQGTAHGTIHGIPYTRLTGGTSAVIIDPVVGDVGVCIFADRDISSAMKTGDRANPGSRRQHDMADGIYLFSCRASAPTQYIRFSPDSIEIVSPTLIHLRAPQVTIEGTVIVSGDVTAAGTSVHTHVHGGVESGDGTTGVPD